jgi:hypothetical protein
MFYVMSGSGEQSNFPSRYSGVRFWRLYGGPGRTCHRDYDAIRCACGMSVRMESKTIHSKQVGGLQGMDGLTYFTPHACCCPRSSHTFSILYSAILSSVRRVVFAPPSVCCFRSVCYLYTNSPTCSWPCPVTLTCSLPHQTATGQGQQALTRETLTED